MNTGTKLKRVIILAVLVVLPGLLYAGQIEWKLEPYPFNMGKIEQKVKERVQAGYAPMGISYNNGKIYFFYLGKNLFPVTAWKFQVFESDDQLKFGMRTLMEGGYFPTGISWDNGLYFVIFLQMENYADSWQILPAKKDLQEFRVALVPYIQGKSIPVGITKKNGEFFSLGVHLPDIKAKSWKLEEYKNDADTIQKAVTDNIKAGFFPWGFRYEKDKVYLTYLEN